MFWISESPTGEAIKTGAHHCYQLIGVTRCNLPGGLALDNELFHRCQQQVIAFAEQFTYLLGQSIRFERMIQQLVGFQRFALPTCSYDTRKQHRKTFPWKPTNC